MSTEQPQTTPSHSPSGSDGTEDMSASRDLVVLSHLRWNWVWQRPQHLVSRFARARAATGSRTWFVEEPMAGKVSKPTIKFAKADGVTRVWLVVPNRAGQPE